MERMTQAGDANECKMPIEESCTGIDGCDGCVFMKYINKLAEYEDADPALITE